MKLSRCGRLATRTLTGTWHRAIHATYLPTPLAYAHTVTIPGRFNAASTGRPGFPVLYLCETPFVAQFEVGALLGSPYTYVPNPTSPWSVLNVTVNLNRVVDLSRPARRRSIETTVQELTGDWRDYAMRPARPPRSPYWTHVPTQKLGAALHAASGVEGFLSYSARVPTLRGLVVFPTKLGTGSSIRYDDPKTGLAYILP